jgi:hypothetical protein
MAVRLDVGTVRDAVDPAVFEAAGRMPAGLVGEAPRRRSPRSPTATPSDATWVGVVP